MTEALHFTVSASDRPGWTRLHKHRSRAAACRAARQGATGRPARGRANAARSVRAGLTEADPAMSPAGWLPCTEINKQSDLATRLSHRSDPDAWLLLGWERFAPRVERPVRGSLAAGRGLAGMTPRLEARQRRAFSADSG